MMRLRSVLCLLALAMSIAACAGPKPGAPAIPFPQDLHGPRYDVLVRVGGTSQNMRVSVTTPDTGPQIFRDVKPGWTQRYYDLEFGDTITVLVYDMDDSGGGTTHVSCSISIIRPVKVMDTVENSNVGMVACTRTLGFPKPRPGQ